MGVLFSILVTFEIEVLISCDGIQIKSNRFVQFNTSGKLACWSQLINMIWWIKEILSTPEKQFQPDDILNHIGHIETLCAEEENKGSDKSSSEIHEILFFVSMFALHVLKRKVEDTQIPCSQWLYYGSLQVHRFTSK